MKPKISLQKCETLSRIAAGPFSLKPFSRVARGFADLGFEEFFLFDKGRIVSLHTGCASSISAADEKFFFRLPDADELVEWIIGNGFEIVKVEFVEQRVWELRLRTPESDAQAIHASSDSLEGALLDAALMIFGRAVTRQDSRPLKAVK